MPETFSLYQLNEYIKRVIALNFEDPLWITCEISQVNEVRGNYYLDLIEKKEESDEIIAQSRANIWYKQSLFIHKKLGDWLPDILKEGIEIKCKVEVDYNERYGLSLKIVDIDPTYTVGKMAIKRAKIIEQLKKERLLEKNRKVPLSPVLQRIAVISSSTAAGLQDFLNHIESNIYGYRYRIHLYESTMQGMRVAQNLTTQLLNIADSEIPFDVICIIRGGGSKLDLSGFDHYDIGKTIAQLNIPVFTGIGHDIDETVTDMVAHTALKTPTAVADYLVEYNLQFETRILDQLKQIEQQVQKRFTEEQYKLHRIEQKTFSLAQKHIQQAGTHINFLQRRFKDLSQQLLKHQAHNIEHVLSQVNLLDPENVFRRGFSVTEFSGKRIKSIEEINNGNQLNTRLLDGVIISTISGIKKDQA